MTDVIPHTISVQNISFVKRLWRGEVSLPITYWIFGSIGSVVLTIASFSIAYLIAYNASSLGGFDIQFFNSLWLLFVYFYEIFIFVAIWRSASNYSRRYPRRRQWSILAKAAVCLGVVGLIKSGYEFSTRSHLAEISNFTHPTTPKELLTKEAMLAGLNAGLPKKIDDIMTLNKIGLDGNTFVYEYSITSQISDMSVFERSIKQVLIKGVCGTPAVVSNFMEVLIRSIFTPTLVRQSRR